MNIKLNTLNYEHQIKCIKLNALWKVWQFHKNILALTGIYIHTDIKDNLK